MVGDSATSTAYILLLARNGSAIAAVPVSGNTTGLAPALPGGTSASSFTDLEYAMDGALEAATLYSALRIVHVAQSGGLVGFFTVGLGPCPSGR